MKKTFKMNPQATKILLGVAAVILIAVIYFYFPGLFRGGSDTPYDSTAVTTYSPAPSLSSKDSAATSKTPEQSAEATTKPTEETTDTTDRKLDINGTYTSKDEVALYIHQYGKLPNNFIKKSEAQALGWSGGGLEKYAPGKCIGGDTFGNYEGKLPKKTGRKYTECDIDTLGASSRGAKRIVFSNDGLIYYTDDHYATFTLLYGNEG